MGWQMMREKTATGIAALGILALSLPLAPTAQAQLLDQLKGAVGGGQDSGQSSGLGSMLGGGIPSVSQASPGNTAGVLQYCIRNNYVNGGSASSVKDLMVNKMSGSGQATRDPSFQSGNDGNLQTGNGQSFSLGGTGAKEQITRKVCDLILQHAKSLL